MRNEDAASGNCLGSFCPLARSPPGRGSVLPLAVADPLCAAGWGLRVLAGSRPSPHCSGQRRRIQGRAARERREGAGGRGCRCSRRPGGEWRGDLGRCWARAKEGPKELVRGRTRMSGGNVPEGLEQGRRPQCWRDEMPPGAGSVVVPAAGGNGRALWCLRSRSAGSRRPALSGAPGADCKSLILRNRACPCLFC